MTLPGDFLFLDESGDPGTAPGSSPVLIVSILHLSAAGALSRAIKRARSKGGGRTPPLGELKWSGATDRLRETVLREIAREAPLVAGVSAGVLVKSALSPKGVEAVRRVALAALEAGGLLGPLPPGRRFRLTVDGSPSYVSTFFGWMTNLGISGLGEPGAADSESSPQLQAADFVAGAVAAFAKGDPRFVEILRAGGIHVSIR